VSNLGQRVLSAAVLGVIFLSALWLNQWAFYALMIITLTVALHEFLMLFVKNNLIQKPTKGLIFIVTWAMGLLMFVGILANIKYGFNFREFIKFVILPIVAFSITVLFNLKLKFSNDSIFFLSLLWIVFPFVLCPVILNYQGLWQKELFLGVMMISWSADIFAYFVGSSIGRHKLIERVSPNKTIEGALGGLMGGLAVAFVIPKLFDTPLTPNQWMVLGIIIVVVSILGDLFESMIKRNLGVKDSGTLIPGHGGVLDRIDSLLFVLPAVAAYLYFI